MEGVNSHHTDSTLSHPHDYNVNHVLCTMDHTLFPNFVLLGHFNIDYNNISHPFHHHLLGFMSTLCLTQVVSEPTRLSSHSSTLIDLVLLSQPPLLISCHTVPLLANSDQVSRFVPCFRLVMVSTH